MLGATADAGLEMYSGALLVTAAVAACGAALAQPDIASIDPEERLLEQIAELRAEEGPTPAGVIAPLRELALRYQENDDHALAIATLEEARYVTRVHQGLASADEALLLREQIRSEKAFGLHERVWDLEQDMLTLARQHHDDARMVPIFAELAEDRLTVLEGIRSEGRRPPMIYLGCYYGAPLPPYDDTRGERQAPVKMADAPGGSGNCYAGSRGVLMRKLRSEILVYYADAIETILKTGDYASQELRQFEKAAIRLRSRAPMMAMRYGEPGGSFRSCSRGTFDQYVAMEILNSCLAPVGRGDGFVVVNVGGEIGLLRLAAYEFRSGASAAARARAIVELADWRLLSAPIDRRHFEASTVSALGLYARAYRELEQGGNVEASAAEIFAPEIPDTLPASAPNPFTPAATASSRYIDVAFAVTKYGRGERIEILDTSSGATRAEERDLVDLIERTSFRPRIVDGQFADAATVTLRYDLGT